MFFIHFTGILAYKYLWHWTPLINSCTFIKFLSREKSKKKQPSKLNLFAVLFWRDFGLRTTLGCMILARCCYIFRIFQKLCLSDWCGMGKPRVDDVWHLWVTLSLDFSAKHTFFFWKWEEKNRVSDLFFVKQPGKKNSNFWRLVKSMVFPTDVPMILQRFEGFLPSWWILELLHEKLRPHDQPTDFPQMVVKSQGNPRLFQGNLGWWSIIPFGQIAGLFVCWFFGIWENVCLHTLFFERIALGWTKGPKILVGDTENLAIIGRFTRPDSIFSTRNFV